MTRTEAKEELRLAREAEKDWPTSHNQRLVVYWEQIVAELSTGFEVDEVEE